MLERRHFFFEVAYLCQGIGADKENIMQAEVSRPSPQKHVLLVDPEVDFRKKLIRPFRKFGYRVSETSDGKKALMRCDAELPNAVVTELSLPGFDGFELARRIRSLPLGDYTSIVAVTSTTVTEVHEVAARSAGCDLLLHKPAHLWSFVLRVDDLIRRSAELLKLSRQAQERAERAGERSARARARAQDVVLRSMSTMARVGRLEVANRILRDLLPAPGLTVHVPDAAHQLHVDDAYCEDVFNELMRLGLLEMTPDGCYRRK